MKTQQHKKEEKTEQRQKQKYTKSYSDQIYNFCNEMIEKKKFINLKLVV